MRAGTRVVGLWLGCAVLLGSCSFNDQPICVIRTEFGIRPRCTGGCRLASERVICFDQDDGSWVARCAVCFGPSGDCLPRGEEVRSCTPPPAPPIVRAPWPTCGTGSPPRPPNALTRSRDVNGDGRAELILGAALHLGCDGSIEPRPVLTDVTQILGDLDGDGYAEFVRADGLVRGGPDFAMRFPVPFSFGGRPASGFVPVGDVNGDGKGDVALGSTILFGGEDLLSETRRASLAPRGTPIPLGDVDGDGFADVGVTVGEFEIVIFHGRAGSAGLGPPESVGWQVLAPVGDANGDGRDEVVVREQVPPGIRWDIFLVVTPGANPARLAGSSVSGESGWALAPAGDVNGDGFADALVSLFRQGDAQVLFGGPEGFRRAATRIPSPRGVPMDFGHRTQLLGDVTGDGRDDLAVSEESVEYVFFGSDEGLAPGAH